MDPIKEAVDFYTGADYLIVNSLLWLNEENIDRAIEAVWQNNTGVMREAISETPEKRFGLPKDEAQAKFDAYRRRTPEVLNEKTRIEMIKTAINDIRLICGAMRPSEGEMTLFRNVHKLFAEKEPIVGEILALQGLTSTSTTGQLIDYGNKEFMSDFVRYIIKIPAGTPIYAVENDYREENEVILPPMVHKITAVFEENGQKTVELQALSPIAVEPMIQTAILKFIQ